MRGTWKTEEADIQGKLTRNAQRQDHAPHIRGRRVPLQSASRAEEKARVGCSPPPPMFPQLQVSPLPSLPGPATPKDEGRGADIHSFFSWDLHPAGLGGSHLFQLLIYISLCPFIATPIPSLLLLRQSFTYFQDAFLLECVLATYVLLFCASVFIFSYMRFTNRINNFKVNNFGALSTFAILCTL